MAYVAAQWAREPRAPDWVENGDARLRQMTQALNSKQHKERWKYSKVQPVLDLIAAPAAAPAYSPLPEGISEIIYPNTQNTAPLGPDWENAPEVTACLFYQPCVHVLEVEGNIESPLLIQHHARSLPLVIRLKANASLDLQETMLQDDEQQVQTLWIELETGARLVHSRNIFSKGQHWQYLRVNVGRDASYALHNHSSGARLRRQDVHICCTQPGANAEICSASLVDKANHLDQQIVLEHSAPHTNSRQTFHAIGNSGARVTFNGRIHIHKDCGGTDATLANKNLSLGTGAVINTKPELEIYTDDVKCAHGATVGQLDDDHLFYCSSRGIPAEVARNLLSEAFLKTCIRGPLADDAHAELQSQFKAQDHA